MTAGQAQQVVRRITGYFPTPQMTDEEALAWAEVLTDPTEAVTVTEALAVVRKMMYAGEAHRPRPGQVLAAVKVDRRAQTRLTDTTRMLTEGRSRAISPERTRQWIAACRRVLDGEALDEAKKAAGLA